MSKFVCNDCGSLDIQRTEPESDFEWYAQLVGCEGARVPVPSYLDCEAWFLDHDVDDNLVDEKITVVVDYWDPKKYKSPWGMLQRYILKELRLQSERTAAPKSGGMLRKDGRYY